MDSNQGTGENWKRMTSLQTPGKEFVKIYLSLSESNARWVDNKPVWDKGQTYAEPTSGTVDGQKGFLTYRNSETNEQFMVPSTIYGANTITINLVRSSGARLSQMATKLAHEFGHAEILATNMLGWFTYLTNNVPEDKMKTYGGHGSKDPSGERANLRETEFKNLLMKRQ